MENVVYNMDLEFHDADEEPQVLNRDCLCLVSGSSDQKSWTIKYYTGNGWSGLDYDVHMWAYLPEDIF